MSLGHIVAIGRHLLLLACNSDFNVILYFCKFRPT
jgi:hypothetical protein